MDIKTAAWAWDRLEGRALGHKILLYRQMGVCYILDRIKNKRGDDGMLTALEEYLDSLADEGLKKGMEKGMQKGM